MIIWLGIRRIIRRRAAAGPDDPANKYSYTAKVIYILGTLSDLPPLAIAN